MSNQNQLIDSLIERAEAKKETRDTVLRTSTLILFKKVAEDPSAFDRHVQLTTELNNVISDFLGSKKVEYGEGILMLETLVGFHANKADKMAKELKDKEESVAA